MMTDAIKGALTLAGILAIIFTVAKRRDVCAWAARWTIERAWYSGGAFCWAMAEGIKRFRHCWRAYQADVKQQEECQ